MRYAVEAEEEQLKSGLFHRGLHYHKSKWSKVTPRSGHPICPLTLIKLDIVSINVYHGKLSISEKNFEG